MKILQFLHRKIKEPSVIGFLSASVIYLFGGVLTLDFFASPSSTLEKRGMHKLTLKLSSVNTDEVKTHFVPTPPKKRSKNKQPIPKNSTFTEVLKSPQSSSLPKAAQEEQEKQEQKNKNEILASKLNQEGSKVETLAYNEGVNDEFLSQIHHAISNHNSYPRIARMRKMEGKVVLEFILEIDGRIEGVKIVTSDASEILNKNALRALYKASKDFPAPLKKVRIKVPVVYRLQ